MCMGASVRVQHKHMGFQGNVCICKYKHEETITNPSEMVICIAVCIWCCLVRIRSFVWFHMQLSEKIYSEIARLHINQPQNCFSTFITKSLQCLCCSSCNVRLKRWESFQFLKFMLIQENVIRKKGITLIIPPTKVLKTQISFVVILLLVLWRKFKLSPTISLQSPDVQRISSKSNQIQLLGCEQWFPCSHLEDT